MSRNRQKKKSREDNTPPTPLNEADKAFIDISNIKVSLRHNGVLKEMTLLEASIFKTFDTASSGSPNAQRMVLELSDRIAAKERARIDHQIAEWRAYIALARKRIAEAQANGEPEPELTIHPDDIMIDHEHGVSIEGPVTADEAKACRENMRLRDVLVAQAALEIRLNKRGADAPNPGSALKIATMLDSSLPTRMRFKGNEVADLLMGYENLTKRELLKQVSEAWKEVGYPQPRGSVLAPIDRFEHLMRFMLRLYRDWESEEFDPASYQEIVDAAVYDYSGQGAAQTR